MKLTFVLISTLLVVACTATRNRVATAPPAGNAAPTRDGSDKNSTPENEPTPADSLGANAPLVVARMHRPPVCESDEVYFALACWTPSQAREARAQLLRTSQNVVGIVSAWAKYATIPFSGTSDQALLASVRSKTEALAHFVHVVDANLSDADPSERGCLLERHGDGYLDFAASISNLSLPPDLTAPQAERLRSKLRESASSAEQRALADYNAAVNSDRTGPAPCWESALTKSTNTIF